MPPFEDLRGRKNADVIEHLSTTTVCSAGSVSFRAIFRDEYVESQDIEGTQPVLTCLAKDACTVEHVDELVVEQSLYRVVGREPDGTGLVRIILELLQ